MLKGFKRNSPYWIYDSYPPYLYRSIGVGFIDDNDKWRVHVLQDSFYDDRIKLHEIADENRREIFDKNMDAFVPELSEVNQKLSKGGVMLHMNHVFEKKALDGMPLEELSDMLEYKMDSNVRNDPVLRRATFKSNEIMFVRTPENPKKNTFDYIHIPIGISGEHKKEWIHENYRAIAETALDFLSNSRRYKRFGVPVNFLKIEKAVLTRQAELILTFGLKNIVELEGLEKLDTVKMKGE